MKYFIFPINTPTKEKSSWKKNDSLSLGGYFYDYLESTDGIFIGLRYYMDHECEIQNTLIFREFEKDPRFSFDLMNKYVDILLKTEYKKDFEQKIFHVDLVQDFGVDHVLMSDNKYGILFEI